MTILVDIDNTITNFSEVLLFVNNINNKTKHSYTDITNKQEGGYFYEEKICCNYDGGCFCTFNSSLWRKESRNGRIISIHSIGKISCCRMFLALGVAGLKAKEGKRKKQKRGNLRNLK